MGERHEKNVAAEKARGKDTKESDKKPWERVVERVDLKEGGYKGSKDISRMKAVMIARKEDKQ